LYYCPKCKVELTNVALNVLRCQKCNTQYYTEDFFKGGLRSHKRPKKKNGSQITSLRLKLFLIKHKEPKRLKAKRWRNHLALDLV